MLSFPGKFMWRLVFTELESPVGIWDCKLIFCFEWISAAVAAAGEAACGGSFRNAGGGVELFFSWKRQLKNNDFFYVRMEEMGMKLRRAKVYLQLCWRYSSKSAALCHRRFGSGNTSPTTAWRRSSSASSATRPFWRGERRRRRT